MTLAKQPKLSQQELGDLFLAGWQLQSAKRDQIGLWVHMIDAEGQQREVAVHDPTPREVPKPEAAPKPKVVSSGKTEGKPEAKKPEEPKVKPDAQGKPDEAAKGVASK